MPNILTVSKLLKKGKSELVLFFFYLKYKHWKVNGEARIQTGLQTAKEESSLSTFNGFFFCSYSVLKDLRIFAKSGASLFK